MNSIMERILPETLVGPRAYFTSFDYRIAARTRDLSILQRDVERKLKTLLLIKSQVVCAASHLSSPVAFRIFSENPVLLRDSIIVPALRADKDGVSHALEGKLPKGREHEAAFYEENVRATVSWELEENSTWFRDRFLLELDDEQSLIRKRLTGVSHDAVQSLIATLRANPLLGREELEELSGFLPTQAQEAFLNYRELVYHMSGARVINCESSLPQENYVDYDLADLQQKRTKLSEEHIFWKLFIELALDSFQRRVLPVELLDLLSFEDILAIRTPLLDSSFQAAYDQLVKAAIKGFQDESHPTSLLDLSALEALRAKLEVTLRAVFEEELPIFLKNRAFSQAKEVASVGFSVALGALGFVPILGYVASGMSVIRDSPALFFNIGELYRSSKAISSMETYARNRHVALETSLENSDISNKSTMLDMIDVLTSSLSEKIRL